MRHPISTLNDPCDDIATADEEKPVDDRLRDFMHHCGKKVGDERLFAALVRGLGERGMEQRSVLRPARSFDMALSILGRSYTTTIIGAFP
ncbi:MAG: hypothetical protein AAF982_12910 [Pseudomonadota bacterium]